MSAATPTAGPRTVPCPRCQAPSLFDPSNRFRPFCSNRCRTGDLGAWANEEFRVPVKASDPLDDELPPSAA